MEVRCKDNCPCCETCKDCVGFQKILDLKSTGLVIYRHMNRIEEVNKSTGLLKSSMNTKEDIFIVHNTNDTQIKVAECISEIDQGISCGRCREFVQRAKKYLRGVPPIDKKDIISVCDHCQQNRIKKRLLRFCYKCQDVLEKYHAEEIKQISAKEQIQSWLSNVNKSENVKTDKITKKTLKCRSYSDLYLNNICKATVKTGRNLEVRSILEKGLNVTESAHSIEKDTISEIPVKVSDSEYIKSKSVLIRADSLINFKSYASPSVTTVVTQERKEEDLKPTMLQVVKGILQRDPEFSHKIKAKPNKSPSTLRKYFSEDDIFFSAAGLNEDMDNFSYVFPKGISDKIEPLRKVKTSAELILDTQEMLRQRAEDEKNKFQAQKKIIPPGKLRSGEKKTIASDDEDSNKPIKKKKSGESGKNKKVKSDDESDKSKKTKQKAESEEGKSDKEKVSKDLRQKKDPDQLRREKEDKPRLLEEKKERSKKEKEEKLKGKEDKQREKEDKQREKSDKQREKEEKQKEKEAKQAQLQKEKEAKQAQLQKEKEVKQRLKDEQQKMKEEKDKNKKLDKQQAESKQKPETSNIKKQKDEEMEADKKKKEEAEQKLKALKEDKGDKKNENEKPIRRKTQEEPTSKDLNIKQVKVRMSSPDDLILRLVKLRQEMKNNNGERPKRLSQMNITPLMFNEHKKVHKNIKMLNCIMCLDSDFELDVESILNTKVEPDVADVIVGNKILKCKLPLREAIEQEEMIPMLYKSLFNEDTANAQDRERTENITNQKEHKPSPVLHKYGEQELPKGVIRYALSDRSFIDKGWTMLPTEKVVRKMNVYRMRPAHPEFDWFERNKNKRLMVYDTGEKLAEFDDKGRGRWFYRNGRIALDYYDAEEMNAQQRFVIYGSGEPDERGRHQPIAILATFDYLGNGVVFDHTGKIRLKYNQTEGVVLDRNIGPVSHWKWHTLNDPPVLQQVMIDTQMAHKDPDIMKLGGPHDDKVRPDNEEMLAIEFDNFIKEKSKKLSQKFKPFQIRTKALKINENFSLKVLDQANIYLIFRDGTTNIKMNIGMILDHQEIVDTDTAEVGEVSNNLERFPARTDSLAGLQRSVAYAQRVERLRVERDRRLRHPEPSSSADKLVSAASKPLKPKLQTVPSSPSVTQDDCMCNCRKRSTCNVYYDTRFV